LSVLLRLFAPFLPFVSEEVWSWWHEGSIHREPWPRSDEIRPVSPSGDPRLLDTVAWVLARIRAAKSERKLPMPAPVARVSVEASSDQLALLELATEDLKEAGNVTGLELVVIPDGSDGSVDVEIQSTS
jgi:valyl-tRNA synthetase